VTDESVVHAVYDSVAEMRSEEQSGIVTPERSLGANEEVADDVNESP
jgi:hypothetical protein